MRTELFNTVPAYRAWRARQESGRAIGFVPTMGGLHEGHLALARRAQAENDVVVVSIYLNRPQFNNARDFDTYPARFDDDRKALEELGVDAIFAPRYEEVYPDDYRYRVSEEEYSHVLEGEHRPGHFDGVLTVVMKLLNIAEADRAYFGEKDWQQLQLVKGMVEAFFMKTEIVACPTERGEGGLALSSRNRRLSEAGLSKAVLLNQILAAARDAEEAKRQLGEAGIGVEYVAEREGRRLAAVQLEGVRLIDNVACDARTQVASRQAFTGGAG